MSSYEGAITLEAKPGSLKRAPYGPRRCTTWRRCWARARARARRRARGSAGACAAVTRSRSRPPLFPVLTGHVSSLSSYESDTPRPFQVAGLDWCEHRPEWLASSSFDFTAQAPPAPRPLLLSLDAATFHHPRPLFIIRKTVGRDAAEQCTAAGPGRAAGRERRAGGQVWDARAFQPLYNIRGHGGRVFCVRWAPAEPGVLFTGADDQACPPAAAHHPASNGAARARAASTDGAELPCTRPLCRRVIAQLLCTQVTSVALHASDLSCFARQ